MKKSFYKKQLIHERELVAKQQKEWVAERRREDRIDRAKKDEELNGVRLQLRDQAATFATKDMINALENRVDDKFNAAISRINITTGGFKEIEAERHGRDMATKEILESTGANKRWLIGISVAIVFGIIANAISIGALIIHAMTAT